MGFPCCAIRSTTSKLVPLTLQNLLSDLPKAILMVLHSYLGKTYSIFHDVSVEYHPSPSLVPIPVHIVTKSIKERLPVMEYSCFLEKSRAVLEKQDDDDQQYCCAVCLNGMQARHEVRELCNCCHVFHRECIDVWIDKGHVTCPLCRSKLFHDQDELRCGGGDPWRMERMAYLFGDQDYYV